MSERYTRLFSLPENLYAVGSPVVIAAGALLKDNQTGKVIAQLKMRNISPKPIKAAKVSIHPLDTVGNPLGGKIEYQYLDLNAARDEDFGQKAPVALSDASTRSFTASVEEVVFTDNSIWTATGEPWEVLDTPGSLRSIGDAELIKQFRLKYGNNCKNLPLLHKDLWYCACGELNQQSEAECHRCQKSLALLEQIDMDELRKERDTRVAAEKEQAEKEAAEAKAHAKKMRKIAAIVVPILVVLIVAAVIISNSVKKSNAYEFALALADAGQYAEAIEAFAALGDYKDCGEQMEIALENQKSQAYTEAIALLEVGKHQEAYAAFEALGDYRDSAERLTWFTYKIVSSDEVNYSITNNTTQKVSSKYTVLYTYDSIGRLLSEEANTHHQTDYIYDESGYLVKTIMRTIWDASAKKYTVTTTREYDRVGNVIGYTYMNEKLGTTSTNKYENEFYDTGILTQQTFINESYVDYVQTNVSFYDEQGKETSRNVTEVYRKDGRVVESRQEYVYDNYGNLSEIKFYDYKDYSLLEKGSTTYTNQYDNKGNLLSTRITFANGNDGGLFEYTYDDFGNVLTYTQKSNGIALVEREYHYGLIYSPGTE